MKVTKEELVQLIKENFTDENGHIDLRGLDFSDFNKDIDISNMKVKGNLYQTKQEVGKILFQGGQKVGGKIIA